MWCVGSSPARCFSLGRDRLRVKACGGTAVALARRARLLFPIFHDWPFSHSPTPKLSFAMFFAGYMITALFVIVSRWQLSFYPEHVIVATSVCSATWQLSSVSRWQLLKIPPSPTCLSPLPHTKRCQLSCVLQGTWQLS